MLFHKVTDQDWSGLMKTAKVMKATGGVELQEYYKGFIQNGMKSIVLFLCRKIIKIHAYKASVSVLKCIKCIAKIHACISKVLH